MLTNNDITKFQELYKLEFGTDISKEEALEQGIKLLTLMSHVYKPMTEKECDEVDIHRMATKDDLVDRLRV